jgi:hypothetical protein
MKGLRGQLEGFRVSNAPSRGSMEWRMSMSRFQVDFVMGIRGRDVMHVVSSDGSCRPETSLSPCILVIAYAFNIESCLLTSCR